MPESMPIHDGPSYPSKRIKEASGSNGIMSTNNDVADKENKRKLEEEDPPKEIIIKKKKDTKLNISMTSLDILEHSTQIGHQNGKIDTRVYYGNGVYNNPAAQAAMAKEEKQPPVHHSGKRGNKASSVAPPIPSPTSSSPSPLASYELLPPTTSIYIHNKEEAFSPQLLEFALHKPIILLRNLAAVCGIDMSLYSTKTLVQAHPGHPVEIRSQMEQSADENWDPTMSKQVWYCTSSRSHTTIAKYAEYQAANLTEAFEKDKSVNPPCDFVSQSTRRTIKFGTNCDLSDEKKWGPQLNELLKLPAWARVVSAGNMLSHVGHQILGMNTVQLYMKVPCARTPGHQENNNFCAVNLNIGPGDSEWFGVANEHWGALQNMCAKQGLSYLHGSWWPNVNDLTAAGIPCYRFLQKPGDLVWVNAGCVHWVQATGWCNNIAWNVGPLTHRQYKVAMERYEWNKTQKYQSIVAMVFLTWNLARNVRVTDRRLHDAIRTTLMESMRITMQILAYTQKVGIKIKYHGRKRNEPAHYCGMCDEEVFNTLFVKEHEKKSHVVHCLRCALKLDSGMKGFICLKEYKLEELQEVFDNFVLDSPDSPKSLSSPSSSPTQATPQIAVESNGKENNNK